MRAMSLAADEGEGEQMELRTLQEQLVLTQTLVINLSQQLNELKDQVRKKRHNFPNGDCQLSQFAFHRWRSRGSRSSASACSTPALTTCTAWPSTRAGADFVQKAAAQHTHAKWYQILWVLRVFTKQTKDTNFGCKKYLATLYNRLQSVKFLYR